MLSAEAELGTAQLQLVSLFVIIVKFTTFSVFFLKSSHSRTSSSQPMSHIDFLINLRYFSAVIKIPDICPETA